MGLKSTNNPFEITSDFWSKSFDDYSSETLRRNGFIINRRMGIKYPMISALLSLSGNMESTIVKYWRKFITAKHKSKNDQMDWVYTKVKSEEKKEKEISPELRKEYCKRNKCGLKEFNDAMLKFPKELKKELKILEEDLKMLSSKTF